MADKSCKVKPIWLKITPRGFFGLLTLEFEVQIAKFKIADRICKNWVSISTFTWIHSTFSSCIQEIENGFMCNILYSFVFQ